MELRHLRYAIAVADAMNFRRAAEQLHISQPPLSQQIRQLEEELGVRLFLRSKRQVSLTASGRTFVEEARAVLAQVEHARRAAKVSEVEEAGHLIVGVLVPPHKPAFVKFLGQFCRRHPNVQITLRNNLARTDSVDALR